MSPPLTLREVQLDRLWRQCFGQPLPILGAEDIAISVIRRHLQDIDSECSALDELDCAA